MEMDPKDAPSANSSKKRSWVLVALIIGTVCALAIGLGVGLGVGLKDDNDDQVSNSTNTDDQPSIFASQFIEFNSSVDPCEDFNRHVCDVWSANNPKPDDKASWDPFSKLDYENTLVLRDILEEVKNDTTSKMGTFYNSCMDEAAIEAAGLSAITPYLTRISNLTEKDQLTPLLSDLHNIWANPFFNYYTQTELHNSSMTETALYQDGLGLPDREMYLANDTDSASIRKEYVALIEKMLELAGIKNATEKAAAAMAIETRLAKAYLTPAEERNATLQDNPRTLQQIKELVPSIDWDSYVTGRGVSLDKIANVSVSSPKFLSEVQTVLEDTSLLDLKAYLEWKTLVGYKVTMLPEVFRNVTFDFYGKRLDGAVEQPERWEFCVWRTDEFLGFDLGKAFVERKFSGDSKAKMDRMIEDLRSVFADRIESSDWMSQETKKRALEKLDAIVSLIGYPDVWRDYSALEIIPGDAEGNLLRATKFEDAREMAKTGLPVDRSEWFISPQTVNAFYDSQTNQIVFPAGILRAPFFDANFSDAWNYGMIGFAIGHELTHAFDDQGSQFDAVGNKENWWLPEDGEKFANKTKCIIDQFESYVVTGLPQGNDTFDGELVVGEATADNGGERIALDALRRRLGSDTAWLEKNAQGLTQAQVFYYALATLNCGISSPENKALELATDPHPLDAFRNNAIMENSAAFAEAFGCSAGQPMAPKKKCDVW